MTDYVSRDLVLKEAFTLEDEEECGAGVQVVTVYDINKIPAADVVEVVRCKDCKWWNKLGCAIQIVDDSDKPIENDYCSFGERRENDGTD